MLVCLTQVELQPADELWRPDQQWVLLFSPIHTQWKLPQELPSKCCQFLLSAFKLIDTDICIPQRLLIVGVPNPLCALERNHCC